MAMRFPASQLNNDDLPTLGRPTMATTGTVMMIILIHQPEHFITESLVRQSATKESSPKT